MTSLELSAEKESMPTLNRRASSIVDNDNIDTQTFSKRGEFLKHMANKFQGFLGPNTPEENLILTVSLLNYINLIYRVLFQDSSVSQLILKMNT